MKAKLLPGIIGGFIGFVVGVFAGGYLGMVVGGTFLGGLEIHTKTGFEGYEISTYVGAVIGAIVIAVVGVKLALKIAENKQNIIKE